MKLEDGTELIPLTGFAIVRLLVKEPGIVHVSKGGIVIPDIMPKQQVSKEPIATPASFKQIELIETSRGYYANGAFIEAEAKPGDRLVLNNPAPMSAQGHWPRDIRQIQLRDIIGIERPAAKPEN